jgi:hypothetical protein
MRATLVLCTALICAAPTAALANSSASGFASSKAAGTDSGAGASRTKAGRWQLVGKKSIGAVTVSYERDGDQLKIATISNALGNNKTFTMHDTGRILSTRVRANGDTVLEVEHGSPGLVAETQRAMDAAVDAKGGGTLKLPITGVHGRSTVVFKADGSVESTSNTTITRGSVDTGNGKFVDKVTNLLMRTELKARSQYELKPAN